VILDTSRIEPSHWEPVQSICFDFNKMAIPARVYAMERLLSVRTLLRFSIVAAASLIGLAGSTTLGMAQEPPSLDFQTPVPEKPRLPAFVRAQGVLDGIPTGKPEGLPSAGSLLFDPAPMGSTDTLSSGFQPAPREAGSKPPEPKSAAVEDDTRANAAAAAARRAEPSTTAGLGQRRARAAVPKRRSPALAFRPTGPKATRSGDKSPLPSVLRLED